MAFDLNSVTEEQSEPFFGTARSFVLDEEGGKRVGWYLDVPMRGRLGRSVVMEGEPTEKQIADKLSDMKIEKFNGVQDVFQQYMHQIVIMGKK